jgi:ABC-type dipeptide/oligopeptide/nickel transport system ATPase component
MELLRVENLSTWFRPDAPAPVKAVSHVSFTADEGQILGIVGESGSGKSVTAKSIMGLIAPPGKIMEGEILLHGRNLRACSERELQAVRGREIAYMIQNPMSAFNPVHTVGHHLTGDLRRYNPSLSRRDADARACALLEEVGIPPDLRDSYPHQFSGGMLQRAALALAIAGRPKLLIADEPTTSLDANLQSQILKLLKRISREEHLSLVVITHNFSVVWELCDSVLVMKSGEIVERGTAGSIYHAPTHPYTRELLDALITMDRKPQWKM